MCNSLLKPLIRKVKSQDMSVFPIIYEDFKKHISYCANSLDYEDAIADLNLFFVELLFKIDLSRFSDDGFTLKSYLIVSLKNHRIRLAIKEAKRKSVILPLYESAGGYLEPFDDRIMLESILAELNDKQKSVLVHRYIYGYSDNEISQGYGISRQAVGGIKRRALENSKKYI